MATQAEDEDRPLRYGFRVQNLVLHGLLNVKLDPYQVAEGLRGRLNGPQFPAAMIWSRMPNATLVLFAQGDFSLLGVHSRSDAVLVVWLLIMRLVTELSLMPRLHGFSVVNVVASLCIGRYVDLHSFRRACPMKRIYQPDVFEGLRQFIFEEGDTKRARCINTFATGRMVPTGAKRPEDHIESLRELIVELLTQHVVDKRPASRKRSAPAKGGAAPKKTGSQKRHRPPPPVRKFARSAPGAQQRTRRFKQQLELDGSYEERMRAAMEGASLGWRRLGMEAPRRIAERAFVKGIRE